MGRYALMSLQPFETKHGFRRGEFLKNSQTEFTFRQGVAVVQRISCWITNPGVVNCKTYHPIPGPIGRNFKPRSQLSPYDPVVCGVCVCVCVCVCVKGGGLNPSSVYRGFSMYSLGQNMGPIPKQNLFKSMLVSQILQRIHGNFIPKLSNFYPF